MKAVFIIGVLAVLVARAACNPECDPTYECAYTYIDADNGDKYTYDLSSLCSASDYVLTDAAAHTYYANICGSAKQNCLPQKWENTYEFGVAVQTWGSPAPACNPSACANAVVGNPLPAGCCATKAPPPNQAACCTMDCQVLGTGPPRWSVEDPNDPEEGGIRAAFLGAAASPSDPFWCHFNPTTGAQYQREVHFVFTCDDDVDTVSIIGAIQNSTNDCHYELHFASKLACADLGTSGGWVFIIILFVLACVYVIGGMAYVYVTEKRLGFPNTAFWAEFMALVREGFVFVGHGCKRTGAGSLASASGYDDIDAPVSGGAATASYEDTTKADFAQL